MFGNSWRLGRVAGVEVRIDVSWAIIAVLVGYSFFARFEALHEDLATTQAALLAAAAAVVFFGSVLTHELAHSLMARARGIDVKGITLFLFGGATEASLDTKRPRDEFVITAVGPLTSLLLAGALWLLANLAGPQADPVPGALGYLAWINLALALFNLLPGFPLDGGRILRSAVWGATGSLSKATRVASRAGQVLGYSLVALGVLALLGGGLGGLWIAAIGWFLAQAAQAAYAQLQVRRLLRGVDVGDVMARGLICIPADLSIADALDDYFLRHHHSAFPVVEDGRPVGLLSLRAIRDLSKEDRAARRVADCMTPLEQAPMVGPGMPMEELMDRFGDDGLRRVLVGSDGELVGIVTPQDITRWLRGYEELELERASS